MNYNVDYFIQKFESIPENKWCTDTFKNFLNQKCSMGHCLSDEAIQLVDSHYENNDKTFVPLPSQMALFVESKALCVIFGGELQPKTGSDIVYKINNGDDPRYQQPTPKQRILAALYDIKKMQTKDIDTGAKVKTVYVAVPTTITEQVNDLILS